MEAKEKALNKRGRKIVTKKRKAAVLTQEEVAEHSLLEPRPTLLTQRGLPTSDKLTAISKWLNVEEHWLHHGPPPRKTEEDTNVKGDSTETPSAEVIKLVQ